MRHSWKNKLEDQKIKKKHKYDNTAKVHTVLDVKECRKCGLRKGTLENRRWGILVYFDSENNWLSNSTLPYSCQGVMKHDFYLKEEDFYV